jgi:hypothetical protein
MDDSTAPRHPTPLLVFGDGQLLKSAFFFISVSAAAWPLRSGAMSDPTRSSSPTCSYLFLSLFAPEFHAVQVFFFSTVQY